MEYSRKMKAILKLLTTLFFVLMMYSVEAQPPPPPGQVLNTASNAIGGQAPIGGGLLILLGLGVVYSGKKLYNNYKLEKEA